MKKRIGLAGEEENEDLVAALFAAILALRDPAECRAFFDDICTPAEVEAMADRWQVARMLEKGLTYRQVSERTGVSLATVTRVARFLHNGNSGYKTIIERTKEKA